MGRAHNDKIGSTSVHIVFDFRKLLFQKQTHIVKIDDAVTDEEQIHPQDPIDSRVALL